MKRKMDRIEQNAKFEIFGWASFLGIASSGLFLESTMILIILIKDGSNLIQTNVENRVANLKFRFFNSFPLVKYYTLKK